MANLSYLHFSPAQLLSLLWSGVWLHWDGARGAGSHSSDLLPGTIVVSSLVGVGPGAGEAQLQICARSASPQYTRWCLHLGWEWYGIEKDCSRSMVHTGTYWGGPGRLA